MTNDVSGTAASELQKLLDEEKQKRADAENMAQALIEEFTSCNDFDDVRNKFRHKLKEFAPAALINIFNLANNAESESVKASLNKWVLEWVMSDKIDGSAGELGSLLKQLQKQPVASSKATTSPVLVPLSTDVDDETETFINDQFSTPPQS